MKTRIISAIIMILIVAAALFSGYYYPMIIVGFIACLSAVAAYEMTHNACGVRNKFAFIGACIYSFVIIFCYSGKLLDDTIITACYCIYIIAVSLKYHKSIGLKEISCLIGMPIIISFAFYSLAGTLSHSNGIYYLLMLLNFSSICDIGAYFTGVTLGKHKLCPEISPKKTIEGVIGGIALSEIVTVILAFAFNDTKKIIPLMIVTAILCCLGIFGDLFASVIKRSAGIKDYGKLIPGHGGILDRFDSILVISPVMYLFISSGVV